MFIDTSAFVAVLRNEPDAERIMAAVEKAKKRYTSPVVKLETVMVLSRHVSVSEAEAAFDQLVAECEIMVLTLPDSIGGKAIEGYERFGKGRGGKAQLNLGDCLSYAMAKGYRLPLLFIGNDFQHTDLKSTLDNPIPLSGATRP